MACAPRRGRVADDAQLRPALRDERITVRQEREAEGMHQSARHDDDANLVLFGRIEGVRTGAQRDGRDADLRLSLLSGHGERQATKPDMMRTNETFRDLSDMFGLRVIGGSEDPPLHDDLPR